MPPARTKSARASNPETESAAPEVPTLDFARVQARHAQLSAELREHNRRYYEQDAPSIPDFEYDALARELRELEASFPELLTPDAPTRTVGGRPSTLFEKVRHPTPMTSLDNAFTDEELADFDDKVARALNLKPGEHQFEYTCELKIDGLSVNLYYQDGQLQWAATRGDGETGEKVTANVAGIPGIPTSLPGVVGELEVRGEVYMSKAAFLAYNLAAEEEGRPLLKNPRNGAAGALRQKDPEETRRRGLEVILYSLGKRDGVAVRSQWEVLEWLAAQGFSVSRYSRRVTGSAAAAAYHAEMTAGRAELPFDADGSVVKLDDLRLQDEAGYTSRAPKWAIAYKFPAEVALSVVQRIGIQTGRTGKLTPVAELLPVALEGSTVSRATLHNQDFIAALDLREGDTVRLHKAGGVIPEVLGVELELRPPGSLPFVFPGRCPVCDHPAERQEGAAGTFCTNPACPAKATLRVRYFASRDVLDIKGLGERLVEQLVAGGLVHDPADLYALSADQLEALEMGETTTGNIRRVGRKTAEKLVAEIGASKTRELWRFIRALGLPSVGEGTSTRLARVYPTLAALQGGQRRGTRPHSRHRRGHRREPGERTGRPGYAGLRGAAAGGGHHAQRERGGAGRRRTGRPELRHHRHAQPPARRLQVAAGSARSAGGRQRHQEDRLPDRWGRRRRQARQGAGVEGGGAG